MASAKLARILESKTDLTSAQIENISDFDGWKLVYAPKPNRPPGPITICFTGFGATESVRLEKMAMRAGLTKRDGVSPILDYLCAGPNAGPRKMAKAHNYGIRVITVDEFMLIAENGELPE